MIRHDRITDRKVLDIFEQFDIDTNLPKHKKEDSNQKLAVPSQFLTTGQSIFLTSTNSTNWSIGGGGIMVRGNPGFNPMSGGVNQGTKKSIFASLKTKISSLFAKKKDSVTKVFELIFQNLDQITDFHDREKYIDESLKVAEKNGQVALAEKIKSIKLVHVLESHLLALDYIKVITEDQLIKFCENSEKGLKLDWIKNFTRNIPAEVVEKKEKADNSKLFDNYVILHYDPNNKNTALTEKEIEKKKDPILFGVFRESRKLYFVADWKDEYCNLTFDNLIDKIGADNLKIKEKTFG